MQKRFSIFPGGLPGLALLILRLTLGITVIAQSVAYLSDYRDTPVWELAIALVAALCGAFLLTGLMTPVVGTVVFFASVGATVTIISAANCKPFATTLCAIYTNVTAVAVALLGPGSFSLDALMFGRRRIIIQGKSNLPRS